MADIRPDISLPVTTLPTVEIENPDEPGTSMIINKEDFDPAVHKVFVAPAEKPAEGEKGAGEGEKPAKGKTK